MNNEARYNVQCFILYNVSYNITQYVVDKLFWPVTPLLESVGQHEPQVDTLRGRVEVAVSQSLIPLLAYARQYEQYLELVNLDIKSYIEYVLCCKCNTIHHVHVHVNVHSTTCKSAKYPHNVHVQCVYYTYHIFIMYIHMHVKETPSLAHTCM